MFRGISHLLLDPKGRLVIPTKYREALFEMAAGQLVLTIDHSDKCLLIYPQSEWQKVEHTLIALPNMQRRVRTIQRLMLGHAAELELDTQGRLLIPAPLREYAGMDKKVILLGQANKFELWDADTWEIARTLWLKELHDEMLGSDDLIQVSI